MDDLARFFGLERRLLERLSTRIEPLDLGTAFFDEENRERYNSNFLLTRVLSMACQRLGFDRIGRSWQFIREPKGKTAEPKS